MGKWKFSVLLMAAVLCFGSPDVCFAKGGGGGGGGGHSSSGFGGGSKSSGSGSGWGGSSSSKSSGSSSSGSGWGGSSSSKSSGSGSYGGSSSSSKSSSPSSSGWGGSSSSKSSDSGWGGSSSSSPSRSSSSGDTGGGWWGGSSKSTSSLRNDRPAIKDSKSSVDIATYEKAKASGKVYQSRSEAAEAFKNSSAAKQYTSTYAEEPSRRPTYIPQTYSTGGSSVTIVYDRTHGGYGYMDPLLGTWIMYSALEDAAMRDRLMERSGYYGGPPPIYPSYASQHWIFLTMLCCIFVGVLIIGGLKLADSSQRSSDPWDR